MAGILTREQEKVLAGWVDDAIKLKGILEIVDGYAARAVISIVDNSGLEKLPEELKVDLGELVTAAMDKDIELVEEKAALVLDSLIDIPGVDDEAEAILFEGAVKIIVGAILKLFEKKEEN
jgi:hypothetical protein